MVRKSADFSDEFQSSVNRLLAQKGFLASHWLSDTQKAQQFAFRVLEYASNVTDQSSSHMSTKVQAALFKKTSDTAKRAHRETAKLLDEVVICGGAILRREQRKKSSRTTTKFGVDLAESISALHRPFDFGRDDQELQTAKEVATCLERAVVFIASIEREAQSARKKLGNLQNPGAPERFTFLKIFLEGWVVLTGKMPNEKSEKFLTFVDAGWAAFSQEKTLPKTARSWRRHINKARRSLGKNLKTQLGKGQCPWV